MDEVSWNPKLTPRRSLQVNTEQKIHLTLLGYESKTWIDWRKTIFAAIQKMQGLVKLEHEECVKTVSKSQLHPQVLVCPLCPHLHTRRN